MKTSQDHNTRTPTIKGVSWLLEESQSEKEKENYSRVLTGISKVMHQKSKWKKNTANRFAGFAKVMGHNIENRIRDEQNNYNSFKYDSLRKSDSNWNKLAKKNKHSKSFHSYRQSVDQEMFNLRKQEKVFQIQVEKVGKLKDITGIFEKKKEFYDGSIEQYFNNYEKEINRTISRLSKGPYTHSKQKGCINL